MALNRQPGLYADHAAYTAAPPPRPGRGGPMRTPTPDGGLWWWRETMDGGAPPIHDGYPEAGWFAMQMVKNGPLVPVRIYLEQDIDSATGELQSDELIKATINGLPGDPMRAWDRCCRRPITPEEYDARIAQMLNGKQPDPMKAINLMKPRGPHA